MRLQRRGGITLVELLVVLGIIAVLIGLILPAVQRVRDAGCRVQCESHLQQIGLALHQYHNVNGTLPPGVSYRGGKDPFPFMSWHVRLLPFIEQEALWQATRQAYAETPAFTDDPPHIGFSTVIPILICPADPRALAPASWGPNPGENPLKVALTSYQGAEGVDQFRKDGVLFLDSYVRLGDITDGTSHTLMAGERPPSSDNSLGWWYAGTGQSQDGSADMVLGVNERCVSPTYISQCPPGPYAFGPGRSSNPCDAFHYWSLHFGGAHFLFADGSVHFLAYAAAPLMPALATRSGGEAVSPPD